jgi:hypothetical protein
MTTYSPQVYLQIDNITSGSPVLVARYQNFDVDQTVIYNSNSYSYAPFDVSDMVQQRSAGKLSVTLTFPGTPTFVDLLEDAVVNYRYKFSFDFTAAEILPSVFTSVVGIAENGSSDFSGVSIVISDGIDTTEAQIPSRKITYDMVPFE